MELFFYSLSQRPMRGLLVPLFSPFSATPQEGREESCLSFCTSAPGPADSHPMPTFACLWAEPKEAQVFPKAVHLAPPLLPSPGETP